MSLKDNSVTQLATPEEPAADDSLDAVDRLPRFAGEEAVPLRDSATLELDRERAERVRTVVGSGRPRRRRPGPDRRSWRFMAVVFVLLAAVGAAVVVMTGASAGGSAESASPLPAHARVSSTARRPSAGSPQPTPAPRPHTRRRADLAADRRAARRRVRDARKHPVQDGNAKSSRNRREGKETPRAAAPSHPEARAEPVEESEENPAPTEVAAEPEAVSEAPAPAPEPTSGSTAPEPAPEATAPPASAGTSEARSPAESEFDFER
ncbi:MAG: hypothetical protein JWO14_3582 [Solirubrobacterales bacterium]|nr:hypothetical protein [Solirubrobacterales bacterium]